MNLTSVKNIKNLFESHGFSFTKSLGQNFLINPSVCPKIAETGGAGKNIYVLEIGTGIGVLTKELALCSKKVIAIEIDRNLKPILSETLAGLENIEIIYGDVLKLDLKQIINERVPEGSELVCCANLPYYITSPVIMKLLEEKLPLKSITVMVQKETAERICAPVGTRECGAISAAVNFYSRPEKLFHVSRGSFMPVPNVDSAVIRLNIHKEKKYDIENEKLFFRIVRSAFSQRRKQIINPLSNEFSLGKEEIKKILTDNNINPAARAEELKMDDFVNIYKALYEIRQ